MGRTSKCWVAAFNKSPHGPNVLLSTDPFVTAPTDFFDLSSASIIAYASDGAVATLLHKINLMLALCCIKN
ncbi:hypothetical protein CUJ84_pRLN2000103 (plasmid) [Rhizobium leguminosarum]|uniref:Uncharacterized protein n=1 Tax=Rhizobium leguminosarum TaxID=384 RepID=A0A2K9ZEM5_RHILE|nr:hypothetical protein CUJ84_pRLN2000103 [Rhizobium leguminosarum]